MKLTAKITPYSSIVGQSIQLCDSKGVPHYMLAIHGTTHGIDKQVAEEIADCLKSLINRSPIEVSHK